MSPALSPYQKSISAYWDAERNDVNLKLGDVDGYYHHHYGIGEVDWDLCGPDRGDQMIKEMHRLEHAQAIYLMDHLGDPGPGDRLLDSGCGRGGSTRLAHERFGSRVEGISISEHQVKFAEDRLATWGPGDVSYQVRNMLDTGFDARSFTGIWNNESTMYVDLFPLFEEYRRLLKTGGRYVTITGCYNDAYGRASKEVSLINAHYVCDIHPRSDYFRAMAKNRFVPITVTDLTEATLPYWKFRAQSSVSTGIEQTFIDAYENGSFQYLLIAADRI